MTHRATPSWTSVSGQEPIDLPEGVQGGIGCSGPQLKNQTPISEKMSRLPVGVIGFVDSSVTVKVHLVWLSAAMKDGLHSASTFGESS
jgi:hypothetical protein